MLETVFSLISISGILALPTLPKVIGIGILVLSLLRALFAALRFRLIKAFTSLVGAAVIAIIMSQSGTAYIGMQQMQELQNSGQ